MRGVHIFEKPCYREIRVMRGRAMRGLPVSLLLAAMLWQLKLFFVQLSIWEVDTIKRHP